MNKPNSATSSVDHAERTGAHTAVAGAAAAGTDELLDLDAYLDHLDRREAARQSAIAKRHHRITKNIRKMWGY